MQFHTHSAVILAAKAMLIGGAGSPAGLPQLHPRSPLSGALLLQIHIDSAVMLAATAMLIAGASSPASVPQLHRHGLLPEAEALPSYHAAPHERPLQGLRQVPHWLWRGGLLHCQEQLQVTFTQSDTAIPC